MSNENLIFSNNMISNDEDNVNGLNNDFETYNENLFPIVLKSTYATKEFLSKVINIELYQNDFSSNYNGQNLITIFENFLRTLKKDIKNYDLKTEVPQNQIFNLIDVSQRLLNLKKDGSYTLINYNTIDNYYSRSSKFVKKVLNEIKENKINSEKAFDKEVEDLLKHIETYKGFEELKNSMDQIENLKYEIDNNNVVALDILRSYKESLTDSYEKINNLAILENNKQEFESFMFDDEDSFNQVNSKIFNALEKSFFFYKTGYELIDDSIYGIDSTSMNLITGPTNHAKSILMLNLLKNMIEQNHNNFDTRDIFIHITLEDDLVKLYKRIGSIFGNNNQKVIRLYLESLSEIIREEKKKLKPDKRILSQISSQLNNFNKGVVKQYSDICKIKLIQANEETFSSRNIINEIDSLKAKNYNVKAIFIDYMDVMVSADSKYNSGENDYNKHGQILHEMRAITKTRKIPIVTITQNKRLSEDGTVELNNSLIGDSFKKARYADSIIQIRMRTDLSIISEEVKSDIYKSSNSNKALSFKDLNSNNSNPQNDLVPFEMKITKAKDGDKDVSKFALFCKKNLRIYDKIDDYMKDSKLCDINQSQIEKDVNYLKTNNLNADIDYEIDINDDLEVESENLII